MHWFRAKRFEDITIDDIQRLVDANTEESTHLEYKSLLLDSRDVKLRPEMGKDVSAFANTEGGDLIFGIAENNEDLSLEGLTGPRDGTQRRIEDLIRENIEPRVRFDIKTLALSEDRFVALIRIPRSLDAPHRNNGGNQNQFWRRNPKGAHVMTSSEIRDIVLQSRDVYERAMAWRDRRITMHENGEGPVSLETGARLYVHAVPIGSQDDALPLHTELAGEIRNATRISSYVHRDFYGAYVHDRRPSSTKRASRLEHWMNSGAFEISMGPHYWESPEKQRIIYAPTLEEYIQQQCEAHTRVLEGLLGVASWLILVSLRECREHFYLYTKRPDLDERYGPLPKFTSNDVRCPPLYLAERPTDTEAWRIALKPVFDRIAQSANTPGSRTTSGRN